MLHIAVFCGEVCINSHVTYEFNLFGSKVSSWGESNMSDRQPWNGLLNCAPSKIIHAYHGITQKRGRGKYLNSIIFESSISSLLPFIFARLLIVTSFHLKGFFPECTHLSLVSLYLPYTCVLYFLARVNRTKMHIQ